MKKITSLIIILAFVIIGYLLFQKVNKNNNPETSVFTYNSTTTNSNFSFNHPKTWKEPQIQKLGTVEKIIFNNGLVVQSGRTKNQQTGEIMSVKEAAQNDLETNPGDPLITSTTIAGVDAQQVDLTIPKGHIGKLQDGSPIPPKPVEITDIFFSEDNSTSTPVIFLRFSQNAKEYLDLIKESFKFNN
ncbi:MAG TPA: hypothetical protein VKO61_00190 [Candidatus Paceibacterota bacterium]|nr:hypothetical protein [Candidatus Paceibacterota bacterium]